jgi:hypothetical protein
MRSMAALSASSGFRSDAPALSSWAAGHKVLNEAARGCEPTHLMLSPSVRPCPLALADRDRRAELEPRDLTAWFFGDPLPGMSALDRRRRNEQAH